MLKIEFPATLESNIPPPYHTNSFNSFNSFNSMIHSLFIYIGTYWFSFWWILWSRCWSVCWHNCLLCVLPTSVLHEWPKCSYFFLSYFRVDFVKYPSLKDVEYFNVTMEPGDCLFIPYKWWVFLQTLYCAFLLVKIFSQIFQKLRG